MSLRLNLVTLLIFIFCFSARSQNKRFPTTASYEEIEIYSLTEAPDSTEYYEVTFNSKQNKSKKLSMLIGKQEAQSIALGIEQIRPKYPLPLDLLEQFIIKSGYIVTKVTIDSVVNSIYISKIKCSDKKRGIELIARPAEAVTIALKFNCPILMKVELFDYH